MAIVDSVVIGSGRNKVGEVTLSTIKGRTIARKYQGHVHNPDTPKQRVQRNKLSNALLIYQILGTSLIDAFPQKGKYESGYNAFMRENIKVMSSDKQTTAKLAISTALEGITISKGSLGTTVSDLSMSYVSTNFESFKNLLAPGDLLYQLVFLSDGTVYQPAPRILTSADIAAGFYSSDTGAGTGGAYAAGWVVKANKSKGSTSVLLGY
jgi:hypothetical protein